MSGRVLAGVVVAAVATATVRPVEREPMEASLQSADGQPVKLSAARGEPVILFYEDRDSLKLNQPLKDELFQRGKERNLLARARVVAVANLQAFDFFPAREIALAFVRDAQGKAGIPIWVDLRGVLSAPPWGLPARSSSVLLLDAEGRVLYQHSGRLDGAERASFFQALSRLLGD